MARRANDSGDVATTFNLGLLYTGGTIGSFGNPLGPLDHDHFSEAFELTMTPVLKSRFPDLDITFIPFRSSGGTLDSTNLQPSDWCLMAEDLLAAYRGHDAFLILHGTDTMAFTASALSFLLTGLDPDGFPNAVLSKTIVVTGSQVPLFHGDDSSHPLLRFDTDAFQNVCGAVSAAYGGVPEVCLFFRSMLFRGNRTAKTNASEFDAFSSPNYPPLGKAGIDFSLYNDHVRHLPTTREISLESDGALASLEAQLAHLAATLPSIRAMPVPAFPSTFAVAGPCGEPAASSLMATLLRALLEQGLDGLILESYGEGNFPSGDPDDATAGAVHKVLDEADDAGVVIVDNTQVIAGTVNSNAYASGSWLSGIGAVGAFDMTPIASYCKLLYLLALRGFRGNGWQQTDVKRLMLTNLAGEIADIDRLDARGKRYLAAEESIVALDGSATLVNDARLGLVLSTRAGVAWPLEGHAPHGLTGRLCMQLDGDLVLYDRSNAALWTSGTAHDTGATSMLILDGASGAHGIRLYIYDYARAEISRVLYP